MINPYVILAAVLFWIASVAGAGWYEHHQGVIAEDAKWQARELIEQAQASQQILAAETAARKAEQDSAQAVAQAQIQFQKELHDDQVKTAAAVRAVDLGTLRLHDPDAAPLQASCNSSSQAGTSTTGTADPSAGELSKQASRFLLDLAGEADHLADRLNECEAVIQDDRKGVH